MSGRNNYVVFGQEVKQKERKTEVQELSPELLHISHQRMDIILL